MSETTERAQKIQDGLLRALLTYRGARGRESVTYDKTQDVFGLARDVLAAVAQPSERKP